MRWMVLVLGVAACDGDKGAADDTDTTETDAAAPTFSADVAPLLNRSCGDAVCHGAVPYQGGLDLTADHAYDQLVGTASLTLPTMPRVAAGDAENSFLIYKVSGRLAEVCSGDCGDVMPPPYGLSEAEIDLLTRWINAGAAND